MSFNIFCVAFDIKVHKIYPDVGQCSEVVHKVQVLNSNMSFNIFCAAINIKVHETFPDVCQCSAVQVIQVLNSNHISPLPSS